MTRQTANLKAHQIAPLLAIRDQLLAKHNPDRLLFKPSKQERADNLHRLMRDQDSQQMELSI